MFEELKDFVTDGGDSLLLLFIFDWKASVRWCVRGHFPKESYFLWWNKNMGFIQFLHMHSCHNKTTQSICRLKWTMMALENDNRIFTCWECINLWYLFIYFQNDDLIFKQKDILLHLPQKIRDYAVSFQEDKIFKHILVFRRVTKSYWSVFA